MTSPESRRIRATLVNDIESLHVPLDTQRREWEEAAARIPLLPGASVQPVLADGVACEKVSAPNIEEDRLIFYLHGGGFTSGSCQTHRDLAVRISQAAGMPVLLVDYRLAPEHPFPAAVEDACTAYAWLLQTGARPDRIAVGGDSAGGGLAVSTLLSLRQNKSPMPAAAVLLSAWADLALTGETMDSRQGLDPLTAREGLEIAASLYAGGRSPRDPLISPVFAGLCGLPPMLIQVGDHELLLSDSVRLAGQAKAAGVEAALEIWPDMWHVWHAWAAELPEAQQALARVGEYVRQKLG